MAFEQLLDQAEDKLGQGLEYFDVQLLFFLLVTFFFKGVITLFEHPVNSVWKRRRQHNNIPIHTTYQYIKLCDRQLNKCNDFISVKFVGFVTDDAAKLQTEPKS